MYFFSSVLLVLTLFLVCCINRRFGVSLRSYLFCSLIQCVIRYLGGSLLPHRLTSTVGVGILRFLLIPTTRKSCVQPIELGLFSCRQTFPSPYLPFRGVMINAFSPHPQNHFISLSTSFLCLPSISPPTSQSQIVLACVLSSSSPDAQSSRLDLI